VVGMPLGFVIPKGYKGMKNDENIEKQPMKQRMKLMKLMKRPLKMQQEAWAFHAKEITFRNVQLF
jgi:hypothetical protein